MTKRTGWKMLGAAWLVGALLAAATLSAKVAPETAAADKILQRWVKAIGGEKRLKKAQRVEYRGQITFSSAPTFEMTTRVVSGVVARTELKTPNGVLIFGSEGRRGWREHAVLGGMVVSPAEAAATLRDADPQWPLKVKDFFEHRRALPEKEVDGQRLQVVELRAEGTAEIWYFDPKTGHRVRREKIGGPEGGETTIYSDFRTVDGLVEAWKIKGRSPNGEFQGVLTAVDWNPTFDAATLGVPEKFFEDYARTEEVLARHLAASGGAEAVRKITSRRTEATIEFVGNGLKFDTTLIQKEPHFMLSEQEVPGMGKLLQGYDGKTGWAWTELQGYREMSGPELMQTINTAKLHALVTLRESLPFRKWLGEREVDGVKCQVVELAAFQGSAGLHFFDEKTGLLRRVESVVHTGPGGVIKVLMDFDDYRTVDGVQVPFRMTMTNPAMKLITLTRSVEHNGEFDDRMFRPRKDGELPEE